MSASAHGFPCSPSEQIKPELWTRLGQPSPQDLCHFGTLISLSTERNSLSYSSQFGTFVSSTHQHDFWMNFLALQWSAFEESKREGKGSFFSTNTDNSSSCRQEPVGMSDHAPVNPAYSLKSFHRLSPLQLSIHLSDARQRWKTHQCETVESHVIALDSPKR